MSDASIAGRIRPGSKKLTTAARKVEGLSEMVRSLRAERKRWSEIEKMVRAEFPDFKRAIFAPDNTPFFRIDPDDFTHAPEIGARIMKLYGEDDRDVEPLTETARSVPGISELVKARREQKVAWDEIKAEILEKHPRLSNDPIIARIPPVRLYRFKVTFAGTTDDVLKCRMECYTAGGLKYWRETTDGVHRCMQFKVPEKLPNGRFVRHYGGRPRVPREDNGGLCLPEKCPEFQEFKCTSIWTTFFRVHGVDFSEKPLKLVSRGYYGMKDVEVVLRRVERECGSIAGTENGEPLFYFTKRDMEVLRFDTETGKPMHTNTFEVVLDAFGALASERRRRFEAIPALPRAERAVSLLEGRPAISARMMASAGGEPESQAPGDDEAGHEKAAANQ